MNSDCNFYHFSLLVSYPNYFLVVSFYYPYFPWYNTPAPPAPFFCAAKIFSYLVARGWENFKFHGNFLDGGELLSFLGEGGYAIFFHEAINDQSSKLKNRWWQNYQFHVCILTFHTFSWKFSVSESFVSSSVHSNSQ